MSVMVDTRSVHKSVGSRAGEVTGVLGPSGSGTSTPLRTVNHPEKADRGEISVDGALLGYRRAGDRLYELPGREVLRQRTRIGFVFRNFGLFPHLTVLDNVVEAPGVRAEAAPEGGGGERAPAAGTVRARGRGRRLSAAVVRRAAAGGAPGPFRHRGRVALARPLAPEPKPLLFDEPTSALDPELVGEVLDVTRDLAARGTTMIVVTHEIASAREATDTVVSMADGRIVERGAPDEVLGAPREERTRAFLAKAL
ncbi:hypothetical protein GCM10010300_18920 [Streptomyces olivaceoviridis]|uniref:amino acid ABC transporter ATP-binding protein n=1 Tax=Streptomyces olivaceoviridis TaxID=1921 RepID=UPI001673C926|nr:ATP-binding cassette domain-containing protein [Streptomyces olivaceoviridis]GGY75532.1 hypothetical protein GCM10010300_18920 [Streptomyces olivaceoviridis]